MVRESEDEDDSPRSTFHEVLECEECRLTIKPEAIGYASVDDVPEDVMCPRCGAHFSIAGSWSDEAP